jgi:hypothetical protein
LAISPSRLSLQNNIQVVNNFDPPPLRNLVDGPFKKCLETNIYTVCFSPLFPHYRLSTQSPSYNPRWPPCDLVAEC